MVERRRRVTRAARTTSQSLEIVLVPTHEHTPDKKNPRKADDARLNLLRLSLAKLGFLMPVYAQRSTGLLLSGHQRQKVSKDLGLPHMPTVYIDIPDDDVMGINLLFNRLTNDFNAFDTGSKAKGRLNMQEVLEALESLPDRPKDQHFAIDCKDEEIRCLAQSVAEQYDKKAVSIAASFVRAGIRIPIVVSESGKVVNGVHRLFAALERNIETWPVVRIPDEYAEVALVLLNYLSMDFHVDDDFRDLLRAGAYRRPQNNRGAVPKSYRFWANGCRSLLDRESYTTEYWKNFRDLHGRTLLDFGAGLCRVAPYLQTKGFDAYDFEPYRIDPDSESGEPSYEYSREQARRFLRAIADPKLKFDSIFLSSVLNSVPFPEDRLAVLCIVHALCTRATTVYGTCRDISDFEYEYGGIRNANYFVFDSEPGVRIGDIASRPKIQKFETQESASAMFQRFWKTMDFWPGGNVFFWRLRNPMGFNPKAVGKALELEFDLPYRDGRKMDLVDEAKAAFSKRLMCKIP